MEKLTFLDAQDNEKFADFVYNFEHLFFKGIKEMPDLTDTIFKDFKIENRKILDYIFNYSFFGNIIFKNVDFFNVDFCNCHFLDCKFTDCKFTNCNLTNALIDRCETVKTKWHGCQLKNISITGTEIDIIKE